MKINPFLVVIFAVAVAAIAFSRTSRSENDFRKVQSEITDTKMKEFVKTISDDSFMGRAPFTPAEEKTINFLAQELKALGCEAPFTDENGEKSYFQKVPLVSITSEVKSTLPGVALHSSKPIEKIDIRGAEMVFCGFGIVAPEYGFDNYKDVDIKGKVAVVLINDPGLYLAMADESNRDLPFKGKELTYYGRWRYKFEEAQRQGAAGIIIIHEEYGAGYNFKVASRSSTMPNLYINTPELMDHCSFEGWIDGEAAAKILLKEGYNLDELRLNACRSDFKSFPLKQRISVSIKNSMVENFSHNVAGLLKGSKTPQKAVVISGHWDYFGIDRSLAAQGGDIDSVYNGAVDNGTTMAWALEVARGYNRLKQRPASSLLIFFPTAEEQGLLGSTYYVENPAISMENTIACINNDMMYPRGTMNDLMIIGKGYYPELDSLYARAARRQGRYITGDPNSHTGMFFRSDQLAFHSKGVPSSWAFGCYDSRANGKEWAAEKWDYFLKNIYHTTSDDYDPDWDWSGIVEDAQIAFEVVYKLTNFGWE